MDTQRALSSQRNLPAVGQHVAVQQRHLPLGYDERVPFNGCASDIFRLESFIKQTKKFRAGVHPGVLRNGSFSCLEEAHLPLCKLDDVYRIFWS